MKHIIFERKEVGLGVMLGSYEGRKNDSSLHRSFLLSEPLAIHIELPEGMDESCVEPVFIEAIEGQAGAPEHWMKNGEVVFEDPMDESWAHFEAVPEIKPIPATWTLRENPELVLIKRQDKANENLEKIRRLRNELLASCDIEIFKLEDTGEDASAWRELRIALRNCTDILKENGKAKLSVENIVPSEFVFPSKKPN